MKKIIKIITQINIVAAIISGLAVLVISFFAGMEAVSRNLFDMPLKFTSSFSQFLLLYATLLGSAYCFHQDGHISVEIILDKLKSRARRSLLIFSYLVSAVFVVTLGWKGMEITVKALKFNWLTLTTIQVPAAYIYIAIPIGCLLMVAALFVKTVEKTSENKEKTYD